MDNVFLKIKGIVSDKSKKKIEKVLRYTSTEEFGEYLFFDYSFFDIPCGTVFTHFCDKSDKRISIPIFCKIQMVSQEFGVLYKDIPKGHRTLCHVVLNKESYDLINSKIQKVDIWSKLKEDFLIATVPCASIPNYGWS